MKKTALFSICIVCAFLISCSSTPKPASLPAQIAPKSDLTKFDQVKLGLPASEVQRLLGEPARTYSVCGDQKAKYWLYTRMTDLGPLPFITVKIDEQSKVTAKGIEVADQTLTLAALETRYGVKDLELVKTVVGCNGPYEKLGADVYRSQELGAEISVSFKGDIQRFVQNDELKQAPPTANANPVCRVKR